ncbi:site-specific integrase [Paenalcaligenes niemegkensis]|uniref:tyrosine-type recombinase/integrase n=1 Tax=Paenalcaligenes niemegkensis TaxID=2895469 RepID=UPI001EE9606F|nr:site-specific integrase [Paenalcaligenes niemegkensis]MCQ9618416.1 site-specific integrase [Paenalcaligenes niemegkensis]
MNRRNKRLARSCPTLQDALTRYLAEISIHKKGAAQESSIARLWCSTLIANRALNRITQADIQRIRDEWLATKAPATVTRRLALLSHLYTTAIKDWLMPELQNPAALVRWPQPRDARDRRLYDRIQLRGVPISECPPSELDWLIQSTRSKTLPTMMTLAVETGMRRTEIALIRREHVDLARNVITVPETKNGETRYVPISPFAKHALRKYLVGRPLRGRIFTVSPESVTRAFIRTREQARQRYEALCSHYGRRPHPDYFLELRLHDLRHEAASRLAPHFDMHQLAKILGHRDTRMTMRYYHPHGQDLARELNRSALGRQQAAILRADRQREAEQMT